MTTLDLRYYDTDTNKWEAPLANNSDLLTLSQNLSAHVTDGEKHLNPGDHARIGRIFEQHLFRYAGDLNTIITPGVYAIGHTATNIPGYAGTEGYGVLTVTSSEDVIVQQYVEYNSTGSYYRTLYSSLQGAWMPWVRLATDYDLHYHVSQTATNGTKPHGIGTAAAQDYETGSWTPVLTFNGVTPAGIVYDPLVTRGSYTRIGNQVTIDGALSLSTLGTGVIGNAFVNGLPFASKHSYATISARYENMAYTDNLIPSLLILGNSLRVDSFLNAGIQLLNFDDFGDRSIIFFNGLYYV